MLQKSLTKYLNIDKGFNRYVVRVVIKGKHFIVWRGSNYDKGFIVAKKVQSIMAAGKAAFLDWYDNDMEEYLNGIDKNANQ